MFFFPLLLWPFLAKAFDPLAHNHYAVYWGQNAAHTLSKSDWQQNLAHYCEQCLHDIIIISFAYQFGGEDVPPLIDLADSSGTMCDGTFEGTRLIQCQQDMAKDIETCQSKDIKVLLSLGGATGSYNLVTADDGKRLAETLWAMFGAGSSPSLHRPFGDASVDGFDLDIEAGAAGGYAAFIDRMRELYATDQTKTYYIGGAPQCPFPDVYLDHALEHAWFDFVWVQFYNNYCNVIGSQFNYDAWEKWAQTKSINKDVRVLVGLPGSPASANPSHYADVELLTPILSPLLKTAPHFGGVMMWDASSAHANRITSEQSYAEAIAEYLSDSKRTNSSLETTAAGATSTRMSPSATSRSRTTESTSYHVSSTRSPTIPTATASSAVLSGDTMFNGTAACSPHGAWICHPLVPSRLGQCVYGQWVFHECGAGLICRGNREGTIYCDYDDLISTLLPTATPTLVE